jgi:ribose transport system permease protein
MSAATRAGRRPSRVDPALLDRRELLGAALPVLALAGMLIWAQVLQPEALSYSGLELLLASAVPLLLAAVSQMFVIALGDIDLGTGFLVGLVNVVAARWLTGDPLLAVGVFAGLILAYMVLAVLIHVRRIPSIIVTLGASFVWLGLALLVLPVPGGSAPGWLSGLLTASPPIVPLPVLVAVVVAAVGYAISFLVPYGAVIRGAGSNADAVARTGWSTLKARVVAYGLAALFGVLAGLAVTGVTASGDATASGNYTLLAIAAVILGGGDFAGGRCVPVGAVIGALAISLVGSLLALLNVSSDYQTGAQGLVLLLVLAGRALTRRLER